MKYESNKAEWKREFEMANLRKRVADEYRAARKLNPAAARLWFKVMKAAEKKTLARVAERMFTEGTGARGLL